DVRPPARFANRVFEGDEVLRQRRAHLHQGGQAEQAVTGAVRRHEDAVQVGIFGDPLQLGDAADVAWVRPDYVDGMALDQGFEILAQVDLFAGVNRCRGALGQIAVDVGVDEWDVVAGDQVFEPGDVQVFHGTGKPDRIRQGPA